MYSEIIVLDTETASLTQGVVEVALYRLDRNLNVISKHRSLIDPECPIDPRASGVHGYTYDDVKDAPTLAEYFNSKFKNTDVLMIGHNCLTGDHEVRTRNGWKRLNQLDGSEEVMQFEPETSQLTFTQFTPVKQRFTGELLKWDSQYHKGIYTPNHRMYWKSSNAKTSGWRVSTAQEVSEMGANNVLIPCSGFFHPDVPLSVSSTEARIMEMIRADGHIGRSKRTQQPNAVRLKLKKLRKVERCLTHLELSAIPYTLTTNEDGVSVINVSATHPTIRKIILLLGSGKDKSYGEWVLNLPVPAREAILDECKFWDGLYTVGDSKKATCLSSVKRSDIYWLTEMANLTGYSAKAVYDKPQSSHWNEPTDVLHYTNIRPRQQVKTLYTPEKVPFDGYVYCVTVPTGAFLVRRENTVWVTGNCAFDIKFVGQEFRSITPLCTLKLARLLYPDAPDFKLQTLMFHFGLSKGNNHSALDDVNTCWELLCKMSREYKLNIEDMLTLQNTPIMVENMPFGKHKGKKVSQLPEEYIIWLLGLDNLDSNLRWTLGQHFPHLT